MMSQHPFTQLSAHALAFERNNQFLFENIQFSLKSGELLQLRGANGSGKSTLLRMLAGFIEPHQGEIHWQDTSVLDQLDIYQQQIHYVGHQNGTKPYLTVQENLKLNNALQGKQFSSNQLHHALEKIGLSHLSERPAANLSAGQARRLSLARLLLQSAAIWFLDEPTTALDTAGQTVLAELLTTHLKHNGIAVVATHQDLPFISHSQTLWLGANHG